ncbi:MAG TPA: hypothetical protein DHW02_22860 [Ktedonobacter sp.]|nr:hypothetical protein [Ktedonobacter sp.]
MTSFHMPVDDVPQVVVTDALVGKVSTQRQGGQERPHGNVPVMLRPRDATIFFILIVLSVFGASQIRTVGTASLLYWSLGFSTFLLPCAYVTYWLATRFPGRGGPYMWATRIMGTHWAFIAAFGAWLPCVFAVISTLANCLILLENILPAQRYVNPIVPLLFLLLFIFIATIAACLPLSRLRYILFVVTALYLAVPLLTGIAGVEWLLSGHRSANVWHTWLTPLSSLRHIPSNSATLYGLVVLVLLGVGLPMFLNGEMRDEPEHRVKHRGRVGRFLRLGAIIVSIAYFVQAWSIAVVLPSQQADNVPATIQVVQMVFGSLASSSVTCVLILSQIASIIAYLLIASRILLLLARDRRLPTSLMELNKHGVPVRSILTQTMMIVVLALFALFVIPVALQYVIDPQLLSSVIYSMLQSSVSLLLIFFTMQLFVFALCCLLKRGKKHPSGRTAFVGMRYTREYRLLWIATVVGLIASLFGIWATLAHSAVSPLLSSWEYALLVVAVAASSLGVAWVICEVIRAHSLLREQRVLNAREKTLRSQLQEAYNELEISVEQQNELIVEVDRLYREQAQAAVTDAITGLPNHRAIMSRIDEEVARCERMQSQCAILFLDIDHFKRVNDTWGHRAGDAILCEVATRLQTTLRLSDVVGRYGGEEFALLLPETDVVGASETAERLRLAIAMYPCVWQSEDGASNATIAITASIGVVAYGMHGTTRETLVERADQAMYRAKQKGRNRICVADIEEPIQELHFSMPATPQQVETTAIQVLTAAASARDRGTDDHAHRMVALAEATAREMQMSDEEIHLVRLGALLHDIGKIGIPDAILHKPGPLTAEEWDIMRLHPEIGQRILSQAGGVFIALANIVVAHHERWDGHGYPRALVGESIPLASRILTVIDSYDAMTSRRVYRDAMSPLAARAELQRCAGSQYDPAVVAAFLRVLDTHDILGALLVPLRPDSPVGA